MIKHQMLAPTHPGQRGVWLVTAAWPPCRFSGGRGPHGEG